MLQIFSDEPYMEHEHIGVVFALDIEAGGLEDLLTDPVIVRGHGFVVRRGVLNSRNMVLIVAGTGRKAAARAIEALIDGHRPELVISAGFAGGLNDRLKRNDVLMADRLVDTSGDQLSIDMKVDPAALSRMSGVHLGRLLTADSVVRHADEKQALGKRHDAVAVDMESFAVAEVSHRRGVRFLAVRVINDTVDDELPVDIEHLLAQTTTAGRLGAAVGSVWRRPSSFKELYRLRENAVAASDRLAKFISGMIGQL